MNDFGESGEEEEEAWDTWIGMGEVFIAKMNEMTSHDAPLHRLINPNAPLVWDW